MKQIPLTKGKFAIVDEIFYKKVKNLKWHRGTGKDKNRTGVWHTIRGGGIELGYFILNINPQKDTHLLHLNGNKLDYRKKNLKLVPRGLFVHSVNIRGKNVKSLYRGVFKTKYAFIAYITKNKVHYYLGSFNKEAEAALVYNKKARELYGEFAFQNKII
jgi:hypothetical protein